MTGDRVPAFADRVERIDPSATIAVSNAAAALEADGVDVVDLSVGEPDFPTPENVVEAGKAALDAGHTTYTPSNGIPELKQAIAAKLRGDGLDANSEEVIVTPGGKQALFEATQALVDAGDEVVLLDPAWVSYEAMVKLAGGTLTRVDLATHDFRLEPALDALESAVTDGTELLVINSPSNPSGAVYTETALRGVRDLAVAHDVTVISDEIYERIAYGVQTPSLATFEGMADRTVTVNGFSKAYAMTGWRLGYLHAPAPIVTRAGRIHSHSVSCATNFVQRAGIEALENTDDAVANMVESFAERRDLLVDLLAKEGVDVPIPDGAFYLMLPVDGDDTEWCDKAIEDAHVATVPGSAFGTPGYARISYAAGAERLREGVTRLAEHGLI